MCLVAVVTLIVQWSVAAAWGITALVGARTRQGVVAYGLMGMFVLALMVLAVIAICQRLLISILLGC